MEVTCPNCESRFNLPDSAVKPNAKLRCSVCQNVFSIGAPVQPPEAEDDTANGNLDSAALEDGENLDLDGAKSESEPASKKKKIIIAAVAIVLLLCAAGGGWWYFAGTSSEEPKSPAEMAKSVEFLIMRDVRQYYVQNEKIGSIFVIQGIVTNEFPVAKDLIEVEAALYAKDKTTLLTKKQLGGTVLSQFQLQVLGEEEMESFLSNQIEILTKNTNVPPKGEVPFMVLFYNPPADVAEFGVKIISSKDVEQQ